MDSSKFIGIRSLRSVPRIVEAEECSVMSDFKDSFCETGENDASLAVSSSSKDIPSSKIIYYYIQSSPIPTPELRVGIAEALEEWRITGHNFIEVNKKKYDKIVESEDKLYFKIRKATPQEEEEDSSMVAKAFFWRYREGKRRMILWSNIKSWSVSGVIMHEIGHILGFRHEHIFMSQSERTGLMNTRETEKGAIKLTDIIDRSSIMSYGYLESCKNKGESPKLSETDKAQAARWFSIVNDHGNKKEMKGTTKKNKGRKRGRKKTLNVEK